MMETREQVKDALRAIGFTNPTMRMVHRITRKYRGAFGVCENYTRWAWKYDEVAILKEVLRRSYEEFGPTYEAVQIAERAFHGAQSANQVFKNLHDVIIRHKLEKHRIPSEVRRTGEPIISTPGGACM